QCDADVVGSNSLLNEVELIAIYSEVFNQLNVPVQIKINNRKVLTALAELSSGSEMMMDITLAIDKLDKIGIEKVKEELLRRGLTASQVSIIENYLSISGNNEEKILKASQLLDNIGVGRQGIRELQTILDYSQRAAHHSSLIIDLTLARGLNYYTGTILEIKAKDVEMGSIGGGGRYDDLTGLFGVPNIPGVGISFGVDRIYDVMEELRLFPDNVYIGTQVLFFNLGEKEIKTTFDLAQQLRKKNIRCEIYHEPAKFDKQFKYAEKKSIPFVVIIGEEEIKSGLYKVKELATGKQSELTVDKLLEFTFNAS
ncbi:MAG TPA: ATP phosphoribosyltransferase regulatory subunit, partial [Chitinophagaceae bacterium]